jgi:pimeloyl-ACP methyl ester carboxylesterase
VIRLLAGGAPLLAAAVFAAGSWFYAGQIRAGALDALPPADPVRDVPVLAVDARSITLGRSASTPREVAVDGLWGLAWEGGFGRIGAILSSGPDHVVRAFTLASGQPPAPGAMAGIDVFTFESDPGTGLDIEYQTVRYPAPLGATPAWMVPAAGGTLRDQEKTWVVFVHGYNAPLAESLRLLGPVHQAGFPALVVAYRNDPGAPRTGDRLRRWGETEWRDVEGAVGYATGRGATRVVLVGYSMGGAVVASFLEHSPAAARIAGVVLDSPALDLDRVIKRGAMDRRLPGGATLPGVLTGTAERIAEARYDIDLGDLDYAARAASWLRVPALVLHGEDDPTVPVAISRELAAAKPGLVTLEQFPSAGHVESWNVDQARYERAALAFLNRVAGPG